MHFSFKSVCNIEHKGVICDITSMSYSSQSTRPTGHVLGKNYSSFLDFTLNYQRMSEIFVPCILPFKMHGIIVFSRKPEKNTRFHR